MARILIIEDDSTLSDAYHTILLMEGYEVDVAADGAEGLVLANQNEPALILLDILMPNMSGIDFLKAYDLKNKHPHTKVIVFSNIVSPDNIKQALELGAAKYLTKATFTPKEMVQTVKEALASKQEYGEDHGADYSTT